MSTYGKRVSNSFGAKQTIAYMSHMKVIGRVACHIAYYVDSVLAAPNCCAYLYDFKTRLRKRFDLPDLGPTRHFLGMHITRDRGKRLLTVSQQSHLEKILENAGMAQFKPVCTPMMPGFTLRKATRAPSEDEATAIVSVH